MPVSFEKVAIKYLAAKKLASGTCEEHRGTVSKRLGWGRGSAVDRIGRADIREFLDWVHEKAAADSGSKAERTANKARENLRAILSWAWEQDYLENLQRLPKPRPQRDVAGRHYPTKADLNAHYFATYSLSRPRGWERSLERSTTRLPARLDLLPAGED